MEEKKYMQVNCFTLCLILAILLLIIGILGWLLFSVNRTKTKLQNENLQLKTQLEVVKSQLDAYTEKINNISDILSKEEKSTEPEISAKVTDEKQVTNSSKTNTKTTKYTQEELEQKALDYYEKLNNYRPSHVASLRQEDDTLVIQLFDSNESHNSTSDWYTVDMNTGVGTDVLGNEINIVE